MKKVIFTYDYGKEKMDTIRDLGYEIEFAVESNHTEVKPEGFDALSSDTEILVCYNPFEYLNFDQFPNLKLIQLSSIGVDQVPVEEVVSRNITVTNNRGGYSIPMGEWIVYKMLSAYKFSRVLERQRVEKKWRMNTHLLELTGKRALFLGTGTISSEAVKRLAGFEVTKVGINTSGHAVDHFDEVYAITDFKTQAALADFLVIAIPHTEKTTHMVSGEILEVMKDDAVIINVARGAIIDEVGLVEFLKKDKFKMVSLDVVEEEPLPKDNPLWDFQQVDITPHNSWISEYRNERRFEIIYKNLKAYMEGEPIQNVVNFKRGY